MRAAVKTTEFLEAFIVEFPFSFFAFGFRPIGVHGPCDPPSHEVIAEVCKSFTSDAEKTIAFMPEPVKLRNVPCIPTLTGVVYLCATGYRVNLRTKFRSMAHRRDTSG